MKDKTYFLFLRLFLFSGAIGWASPIILFILPKEFIIDILIRMWLQSGIVDPMIIYWFFMAITSWCVIGFFFLVTSFFPLYYFNIIPLIAIGSIFHGVVLAITGIILKIPIRFFLWDVSFCIFWGGALLFIYKRIRNCNSCG